VLRLAGEQGGHIAALVFSPCGRLLVSGSSDCTLWIWDVETGEARAVLEGHEGPVRACVFLPGGTHLISASADGTLRIWDVASAATRRVLTGHAGEVTGCASFPCGRRALSASSDGTLRVWDLETGAQAAVLTGHETGVESCGLNGEGTRIASGACGEVLLWDASSGRRLASLEGHTDLVTCCAFSPDGGLLAAGSLDGTICLWAPGGPSPPRVLDGQKEPVWGCAFTPDGRQLISAAGDGAVRAWNAEGGALAATLPGHGGGIAACAISPDGSLLASASHGELVVRSWPAPAVEPGRDRLFLHSHQPLWILDERTGEEVGRVAWTTAVAPDGERLAYAERDDAVGLCRRTRREPAALLIGHNDSVTQISFSPDGARLLSNSSSLSWRFAEHRGPLLWDPAAASLVAALAGSPPHDLAAAFSPDGARLVCCSRNALRLFDAGSGSETGVLFECDGYLRDYAWSPDGSRVIAAHGDEARLLRPDGAQIAVLGGHGSPVVECGFSPDGSLAYTRSEAGVFHLWASAEGAPVATLSGAAKSVAGALSADASRVVLEQDGDVALWRVEPGAGSVCLAHITGVASWALDSERRWLAAALRDEWVEVWDLMAGGRLARYPAAGDSVTLAWGERTLAARLGDTMHVLEVEGIQEEPAFVLPWRAEGVLHFACPRCRHWADAPEPSLGVRLDCAGCGTGLRLALRTIEGDWQRVARACRRPVVTAWQAGASSTLQLGCPWCHERLELDAAGVGTERACPKCGEPFAVARPAVGRALPAAAEAESRRRELRDAEWQKVLDWAAVEGERSRPKELGSPPDVSRPTLGAPPARARRPWWKPW
jgi:WD40 repeat protein